MRIKGQPIAVPKPVLIPIPRSDGNLYFQAQIVLDYSNFDQLVPEPPVPWIQKPGQERYQNPEDTAYKAQLLTRGTKRIDWLILESLKATEGLEWETVKADDPNTWHLYKDELRDSGLTPTQIQYLVNEVLTVNSIDERKVEEARRSFLATATQEGK